MQDLSSGEMRDLTPFLKDIPKVDPAEFMGLQRVQEQIQAAKDAVQPDRSKQGPVFAVGEVLEIRGGRSLITKIEPGHMRLKSLPSYIATQK